MAASPKTVCVPCRRVYKGEGRMHVLNTSTRPTGNFPKRWMGTGAAMHDAPETCPVCHTPTIAIDYWWRPPKRTNTRAWKRIANGDWLWENDPLEKVPGGLGWSRKIMPNPNWKKGQYSLLRRSGTK